MYYILMDFISKLVFAVPFFRRAKTSSTVLTIDFDELNIVPKGEKHLRLCDDSAIPLHAKTF